MMEILPILSTLRRHKITAALLILEIALTCAIVCNAVFLISQRIERMNMTSGVAEQELIRIRVASIGADENKYARDQEDLALLRQIPGVTQVASVNQIPFGNSSNNSGIKIDPDQKKSTLNATNYYGTNLAETLGTQLIAGRNLRPDEYMDLKAVISALATKDEKALPRSIVITKAMADRLWPGQDPLGKPIYFDQNPIYVVGVVKDLVRPSIWDDSAAKYSMIMPMRVADGIFLIRTSPGDRDRVLKTALEKLKAADPHRVVLNKDTLEEVRSRFFQDDRSMTGLLAGVCVALLVVTALGIVGLGSFWVAQRRRQIGVRRALGATRGNILRYFQTENFLLATIGIVLGMVLAYGINLFLMVHYELPRLPGSYFPIGALALWLVGQIAVLGPAMRAAAVPPVVATRAA
jgi:putative ABC transport system permease protein